jgi:hypothetical protein
MIWSQAPSRANERLSASTEIFDPEAQLCIADSSFVKLGAESSAQPPTEAKISNIIADFLIAAISSRPLPFNLHGAAIRCHIKYVWLREKRHGLEPFALDLAQSSERARRAKFSKQERSP